MGVDHDCIFAYGFYLIPFGDIEKEKKDKYNWDQVEKFMDENNLQNICFATDAYQNDVVFVYIMNSGFRSSYRGNYTTFNTSSSPQVQFAVTDEQIKDLLKIREHFKEFLLDDEIGWTPYNYAH